MASSSSETPGRNGGEEEPNIWNHWADMQEPLLAETPPRNSSSPSKQQHQNGRSPPTASARVLVEEDEEEDPNNPRWLDEASDNVVEGRVPPTNNGTTTNDLESNEQHLVQDDSSSSSWEETHSRSCCVKCICCLCQPIVYVLHRPLIMETWYQNLKLQIRFLKFLILTVCGIVITREVVFRLNWEHRHGLTLWETWKYDGNSILLDCIVFFSVGRLANHKLPIDHVAWVVVMMMSSMYTSVLPAQFPTIFQHNFSLYELHCTWPWQLWVFVGGFLLPIILGSVLLHINHARHKQQLTAKLLEVIGTAILFLLPQILDTHNFDFHHYYAGLLCGMHANVDVWWSRMVMAWCWGQYVNGIAVWGRDPTLQCGYAHYIAQRQNCCGWNNSTTTSSEGLEGIFNKNDVAESCVWTTTSFLEDTPDWRHCPKPNSTEFYGLW